jgi:hypothetical protein
MHKFWFPEHRDTSGGLSISVLPMHLNVILPMAVPSLGLRVGTHI